MRRITILGVSLAALGLFLVDDAEGFSFLGNRWQTNTARIYVNPARAPFGFTNAVVRGMRSWNLVPWSRFRFVYGGFTARTPSIIQGSFLYPHGQDWTNVVGMGTAVWPFNGALARTTRFSQGARTLECDTAFNPGVAWSTSGSLMAYDIESIAAHELGHVLGLGHTNIAGSTMVPSVARGDLSHRTLEWDDRAGVRTLYP